MNIRITADLPVAAEVKPEIGSIHEVIGSRLIPTRGMMYTIAMGRGQIGVFENECEEVIDPTPAPRAAIEEHGGAEAEEDEELDL